MRPLEAGLIAGAMCLFFVVNAKDGLSGGAPGSHWELRPGGNGDARFTLEVREGNRHWRSENPRRWSDFRGISEADLRRTGPVKFEVLSEAGTMAATGEANGRRAKGDFVFKASPEFKTALVAAGYDEPSDEQCFEFMMHGVTLEFAKAMRGPGLETRLSELNELAVHGVKVDYLKDVRAAGFDRLTARDLVEMKIHGVNGELLRAVKKAGYDGGVRDIVEMKIHGVSPEFLEGLAKAGLKPEAREVVEMRIHGVSPEYLTEMAAAGYGKLNAKEVVEMRIHGVDPELPRSAKKLGYDFTARELVEMRQHGVDGRYLERLADSGYKGLSAEKIVKLRQHGIE